MSSIAGIKNRSPSTYESSPRASGGGGSGETTTIVTHATGAYAVPANNNAMVDTRTGSIGLITLGTGPLGSIFEVSDYGEICSTNNITVAPSAGLALEDPNSPGGYALPDATCTFVVNGTFCRWRFDGVSRYKIVAMGT
jgi:hypothetical protein